MMRLMLFTGMMLIVFLCALGLTVWLTGLLVAAGATIFAVGALAAVSWLLAAAVSSQRVKGSPYPPLEEGEALPAEELAQIMTEGPKGSREWESLAETKSWFNSDCARSTAIYTRRHHGGVSVRNVCFSEHGAVRDVQGEAHASKMPGVLHLSFFPGIFGQYVVRKQDGRFLIVTDQNSRQGWLLHAVDDETLTKKDLEMWRSELRARVSGEVFDIEQ